MPSPDAEASVVPSGENATEEIPDVCPSNVEIKCPVSVFQR